MSNYIRTIYRLREVAEKLWHEEREQGLGLDECDAEAALKACKKSLPHYMAHMLAENYSDIYEMVGDAIEPDNFCAIENLGDAVREIMFRYAREWLTTQRPRLLAEGKGEAQ